MENAAPTISTRLTFPEAEQRQEWLRPLLDAYALVDQGVDEAIRRGRRQGRRLACGKGCGSCCEAHADIPVYPLELIGIYWYATEEVRGPQREALIAQLRGFAPGKPCPFLLEGACAIHPLRPMACRNFNVFGERCSPGEDAYHTRRGDVMTPIRRYVDEAFDRMLPFYGVTHKAQRRRAIQQGLVHAMAKVLQELEWGKLAERMEGADRA